MSENHGTENITGLTIPNGRSKTRGKNENENNEKEKQKRKKKNKDTNTEIMTGRNPVSR